ncbi:hypothetical protein HHX48_18395 [Salinimonas sp. HHU 13199]|nr:hypothetical protein [Salinimonas profundi]MBD3587710.1 hypothetical protein [Salinimonas profundi]
MGQVNEINIKGRDMNRKMILIAMLGLSGAAHAGSQLLSADIDEIAYVSELPSTGKETTLKSGTEYYQREDGTCFQVSYSIDSIKQVTRAPGTVELPNTSALSKDIECSAAFN